MSGVVCKIVVRPLHPEMVITEQVKTRSENRSLGVLHIDAYTSFEGCRIMPKEVTDAGMLKVHKGIARAGCYPCCTKVLSILRWGERCIRPSVSVEVDLV